MTDSQFYDVFNLTQSCQQAEDALSQGMDKLQQTLAETVAAGHLGDLVSYYNPQPGTAMEKLVALVSFVNQVYFVAPSTSGLEQYFFHPLPSRLECFNCLW